MIPPHQKKKKNRWSSEQPAKTLHQHPSWPTSRKEVPGGSRRRERCLRQGQILVSCSVCEHRAEFNRRKLTCNRRGSDSSQLIKQLSEPRQQPTTEDFPCSMKPIYFLRNQKGHAADLAICHLTSYILLTLRWKEKNHIPIFTITGGKTVHAMV